MTRAPVQPAAVRRKVESWIADTNDSQRAIALRARPVWTYDPLLTISNTAVRVVPCPTPLAARTALHDRRPEERLVLLTELTDVELGDGLLAHVSGCTVRSVDEWDLVRQMFGLDRLDPMLTNKQYGGGSWIAKALTEHVPAEGWPPPPGNVLNREHVLRCLTGRLLGIDGEELDSAGLLQWSATPQRQLRFNSLPTELVAGITRFLQEIAGPAAEPLMGAVRAGHGVDAIPLGLVVAALWSPGNGDGPSAEVAAARARLEPLLGGARLTDQQAQAFRDAAEAWVDRAIDSGDRSEADRLLARAETLAAQLGATNLLGTSDLLPSGLTRRMHAFADAVRLATPPTGNGAPALIVATQRALADVAAHRALRPSRLETARMALRALRWLAAPDRTKPATLLDAVHRQVSDDGWVDRARLDLFAGDVDQRVADAYALLHHAVDARRARHDEQFAKLLAADTAANTEPGALLLVEDLLKQLVQPIVKHGRRVLLLVLDGMSVAAATELAEAVTRSGPWLELTPAGGARAGVLAALPTITEVSRCSLFSGQIAVGGQRTEKAAFSQRFPGGVLLHKAQLRAGAGAVLDLEVQAAVSDAFAPVVAAVLNTIDDALDRSDPGTTVWDDENVHAVGDLLQLAQDRVVVITSDHGHVVDRGPDARTVPSPSRENRWRPATPPPGDGEIAVTGSRVAKCDGSVVLPWREELRYGPRKAGYHGGASAAEAVIPLIVLATDENSVPGWSGAPVTSPEWWREPTPDPGPEPATPGGGPRRRKRPTAQDESLFDPPEVAGARHAEDAAAASIGLVDALLASKLYQQRKDPRVRLDDDRVASLLGVLVANGGRATLDTLAAQASVPAHRINVVATALRRVLQVEGYPVLDLDQDGQTIKLDTALLIEQFQLEQP